MFIFIIECAWSWCSVWSIWCIIDTPLNPLANYTIVPFGSNQLSFLNIPTRTVLHGALCFLGCIVGCNLGPIFWIQMSIPLDCTTWHGLVPKFQSSRLHLFGLYSMVQLSPLMSNFKSPCLLITLHGVTWSTYFKIPLSMTIILLAHMPTISIWETMNLY